MSAEKHNKNSIHHPGQNDETRLPKTEAETDVTSSLQNLSVTTNASGAGNNLPVSTQSTLSPYAQIFVPRQRTQIIHVETLVTGQYNAPHYPANTYSARHPRPTSSVSNRLKISRPNVKTPEEYDCFMASNKYKPMEKLNLVIDLLQSNAISFEVIQGPFIQLAAEVRKDSLFQQLAIKVILNETLHKPNFCYNGARLCVLFSKRVPAFHSMVAEQCLTYLQTYKTKCVHTVKDHDTLRGIVNTLGEVLYHFADKGVQYTDMAVCSHVLYETMTVLIRLGNDKACNIKTVCQSLKLSGRHLQKSDETAMSNLLMNLEESVMNETDENMKLRVRNIRGLYNTNWGYEEETPSEADAGSCARSCQDDTWEDPVYGTESNDIDDTVYYGPDGKVLTPEEVSFLYCNTTNESTNDAEDEDALWDPENELGPEIQKAFKEFVQYSKNKKN